MAGSLNSVAPPNKVAPENTRKLHDEKIRQLMSQPGGQATQPDLTELGFEICHTEEEQMVQLKRLRDMPCPFRVKRMLREQLMSQRVTTKKGLKGWLSKQRTERRRCALFCKELSYKTELWLGSFKEIEGHFGSGVLSYFLFLKWLFLLDLVIFGLLLIFIVVPQLALGTATSHDYPTPCSSTNESLYKGLLFYGNKVGNCSNTYQRVIVAKSGDGNGTYQVVSYIADFFQGTGFMENTALFYGYYSSSALVVNIQGVSQYVSSYNLPFAYILVTVAYFIVSLILMVRQSAKGFKENITSTDNKYYQYCNKVFGTWDFALSDIQNIVLKKKSIFQDITHDLSEQRDKERRQARTTGQSCRLWTVRLLINAFVLGALGGSGYLIYYVTFTSSEIITTWPEYKTWNTALQFLIEFLPSLSITLLNIIVPTLFEKVVAGEDYTPQTEVQLTLIRTVFLRLSSLAILFATLYVEINCANKNDCDVGIGTCQPLYCWETGIGQQLYKLVVTDLVVQVATTLFVEFPRKLIVSKCSCKLAKIIGCQQFIIPKNVLDLIYSQTLCWLGAFFSPLIPAICVAKFFVLFYTKKVSLLSNFIPNDRPYRASRSNSFFVIVLLISFLICCFPVIYVVAIMTPSRGCGPFRPYRVMYESITATICEWPSGFQQFLSICSSVAFTIPVIMVLCLAIYYQCIVTRAQKERVSLLKDQLLMEGKDKHFLLTKLNEMQGKDVKTKDTQRQSQNAMMKHDSLSAAEVLYEDDDRHASPPGVVDPNV